ncbi:MAG: hypothetical protein C0605_10820 [Hyphomicrobiales bacterium]|nr:MAG: hypothetical protein C0605_10820 [Hyphomicrobiales bacterium]
MPLLISLAAVLTVFFIQGRDGLNLGDEGFLWYGVQRVLLGEVPKLDFKAYDPGRYYWAATYMKLVGDNGIIALRQAVAIFQWLGLFVGLFLINSGGKQRNLLFLSVATVILLTWMLPRHKLFDISLSIFMVGALTALVRNPSTRRYFLVGLCVGLTAVFGRNHGVYGAFGSLAVMLWLNLKSWKDRKTYKAFAFWGTGVALGYLPILLMLLLIPGFFDQFWANLLHQASRGGTNLKLPVPWPWLVDFSWVYSFQALRNFIIGSFFLAIIIAPLLMTIWIFWQRFRERPVSAGLVAAAPLALIYAHFAFSRADINHLAQGIFPFLLGCLLLLSAAKPKVKWPLAALLCGLSLVATLPAQPGWACLDSRQCVDVEISGQTLKVTHSTAKNIALLQGLARQFAPNGQSFVVTPLWPGAYPLLQRKSPMWTIYALWARGPAFDRAEIERIKAADPGFALVIDIAVDGRDDLRFKNTHPLINQYFIDHYVLVDHNYGPAFKIYRRRETGQ